MKGLWLGNFLLSSGWLFLSPILARNYLYGVIFIVFGLIFNIVSLRHVKIPQTINYRLACPVLIISIIITPFPYSLPFVLLLLGIFAGLIPVGSFLIKTIEKGFLLSGCILLVQSAMVPFYLKIAPRVFDLTIFAYPSYLILKFLGLETIWTDHFLFVRDSMAVFNFSNDIEKFGIYLCLNLFLGSMLLVFVFCRKNKFSEILKIFFLSTTYIVYRYVVLIIVYLNYKTTVIFFNPWITAASFLPLIWIISYWVPIENDKPLSSLNVSSQKGNKAFYIVLASSALGIFMIIGAWGFHDPGKIKKGRILINEKHSDWEWTTLKFDKNSFGQKAVYNYYSLSYFLQQFYTVETNFDDLTLESLGNTDVLIIKMPTEPLGAEEIFSIITFVKKGGGLFLIGDHTNVFGTSGFLNQLSEKFGLRFNFDATYDLLSGDLSFYEPSKLLPHPVVKDISSFLFGTSCTLSSSLFSEDVITGYQLRSVNLDYSKKHFFPEQTDLPDFRFGTFLQCSAVKYGKGRVLAFTDSTVFSNFWMFIPGKPELLMGSINWLNRENLYPNRINTFLLFLGSLLLIVSLVIIYLKNPGTQKVFYLFSSSLLCISCAFLFYNFLNSIYYQRPLAKQEHKKVFFNLEHSDMPLPLTSLVPHSKASYENFFILPHRLGYIPVAQYQLDSCLEPNSILIVMNSNKKWTQKSLHKLKTYIQEGGTLIVMDNRCNKNSTSNFLLEPFHMKLDFAELKVSFFKDFSEQTMAATECAMRIDGGQPVLTTLDNDAIVSVLEEGKGQIIVIGDSYLFSDRTMGNTMSVPNSYQKRIYEIAYQIFEDLLSNKK